MKATISERESLAWAHEHDLSLIVDFHNEVKRSFQKEIARINANLEISAPLSDREKMELEARKDVYADTFGPYLMTNTFLMMVSHLEAWLYHVWKHHAPAIELFEAKGSIGRFKPVLNKIGVDLSRSGPWMFLKNCQDVRSCLLHANGKLSLNRNPERIRNFVAQHGDIIGIDSDRLVLKESFLTDVQKAVEQLIHSVKLA